MSINRWIPKKIKFKRPQKGRVKIFEFKESKTKLTQGFYGLQILKNCRLTEKQLEAARRKISKSIKKKQKLWFRTFPNIAVTAKPNEIRMGKGKGNVTYWASRISAGRVIFELSFMPFTKAKLLLLSASKMLPVPTKLIYRKKWKI